jgi:hypothetical protein
MTTLQVALMPTLRLVKTKDTLPQGTANGDVHAHGSEIFQQLWALNGPFEDAWCAQFNSEIWATTHGATTPRILSSDEGCIQHSTI